MTKLQDDERSSKTMADNLRWLDQNVGKLVRAEDGEPRANADGTSAGGRDENAKVRPDDQDALYPRNKTPDFAGAVRRGNENEGFSNLGSRKKHD